MISVYHRSNTCENSSTTRTALACSALIATLLVPCVAYAGVTNTIDFDEIPLLTPADGLAIDIVTFSTSDPTAVVSDGAPDTPFTSGPGIGGDPSADPLRFTFDEAVSGFTFGFALGDESNISNGAIAEVFNARGESLGVFTGDAMRGDEEFPVFGEVIAEVSGSIRSVSVVFADRAFAYQFDNLSYTVIPSPGGTMIFALAAGILGVRRRPTH